MGIALASGALLGACIAVLPAIAVETDPTIEAINIGGGIYGEEHRWSPAHATIAPGGAVSLSNPGEVKHGVEWVSGPGGAQPNCSAGVPVGSSEAASAAKWSGTCTFTAPGTYVFYCTVHHAAMAATVTVSDEGTPTTTTPTGFASPTGAPATGAPPSSPGSGSATTPSPTSPTALLVGGASALALPGAQHGYSVHGTVHVAAPGAGARLAVTLLVARTALAGAASRVPVGRLVRSSVAAGVVRFAVALDARARRALRARGRLALLVRVALTPAREAGVSVSRSVLLRAR